MLIANALHERLHRVTIQLSAEWSQISPPNDRHPLIECYLLLLTVTASPNQPHMHTRTQRGGRMLICFQALNLKTLIPQTPTHLRTAGQPTLTERNLTG